MPPRDRRLWSAALPLLTLAALFGMHGLGDHTGAHATEVGHHAMAMVPGASADTTTPDTPAVDARDAGSTTGVAVLCVGILLGAGLALVALTRAARRSGWDVPLLARQEAPRPHCRDPDPPSLHVLSVCRC